MRRTIWLLSFACGVLFSPRMYSQASPLDGIRQAIENNARVVHSRWVASYQVRLELHHGNDYDKEPFRRFPIGTLTPLRSSDRWCWQLTEWSDGFAGKQPATTCITPGEHRWFAIAEVFNRTTNNIKLIENTSSVSVFEIFPRAKQERLGMPRSSACASSVHAKLTVDRRTSHPVRLAGYVKDDGCNVSVDRRSLEASGPVSSIVDSPRRGSGFKYVWTRKESSVSDDYSAWVLTEAYESDQFWMTTKDTTLLSDWIYVLDRKFTLVERDVFGNPRNNISRVYPRDTMLTVHTTAYEIEEFTVASRVIN